MHSGLGSYLLACMEHELSVMKGGYATCLAVLVSGPKLEINAVRRAVKRGSSMIVLIVSALMDVRSLEVYTERSSAVGT